MKKLISILAVIIMLFTFVACGEEEDLGVTIVNDLDADLIDVKIGISDGSINGIILAEKLAIGESAVVSLQEICNDSEGFVSIVAMDDDANIYSFFEVMMYDGIEIKLTGNKDSNIYAEYPYNGSIAQYSGKYVPGESYDETEAQTEEPGNELYNEVIEGEWLHSDDGSVLVLDGVENYTWTIGSEVVTGTYIFDGETLTLNTDEGGYSIGILDEEDHLIIEGDAGSYYYRSDE